MFIFEIIILFTSVYRINIIFYEQLNNLKSIRIVRAVEEADIFEVDIYLTV